MRAINGSKGGFSALLPDDGDLTVTHRGYSLKAEDGRRYTLDKSGHILSFKSADADVKFNPNGGVEMFKSKDLKVAAAPNGFQRIEQKSGDDLIVRRGKGSGYVQTALTMGRVPEQQRVIWDYGKGSYAYYVVLQSGAIPLNWYQPPVVYDSLYYSWLQTEDDIFGSDPPRDWFDCSQFALPRGGLVRWMANNLAGQMDQSCNAEPSLMWSAGVPSGPEISDVTTPVDESLRASLADSIAEVLRQEEDQASGDAPSVNLPVGFAYPATSVLYGRAEDDSLCALGPGDVVALLSPVSAGDVSAQVAVRRTQRGDCLAGANVAVAVDDLAEMWNELHRLVDIQLAYVAENQGKRGLPRFPGTVVTVFKYSVSRGLAETNLQELKSKHEALFADAEKKFGSEQDAAFASARSQADPSKKKTAPR